MRPVLFPEGLPSLLREAGRPADKYTVMEAASCTRVDPVSCQEARCSQHSGEGGIREGFVEERIPEWSSDT